MNSSAPETLGQIFLCTFQSAWTSESVLSPFWSGCWHTFRVYYRAAIIHASIIRKLLRKYFCQIGYVLQQDLQSDCVLLCYRSCLPLWPLSELIISPGPENMRFPLNHSEFISWLFQPCVSRFGVGTRWSSKVPSNANHSVMLLWDWRLFPFSQVHFWGVWSELFFF